MSDTHPVVRHALLEAREALETLEDEIRQADTVLEALRLRGYLASLESEVDRLERAALDRADALCGGPHAASS